MKRTIFLLVAILLAACAEQVDHTPSQGAKGMAGASGTFEYFPQDWKEGATSWWKDSDGIDPGIAGCHIGTDIEGVANGRMFGEACLPNGLLVESNPGTNELHSHANDTGHPDTFDCAVWCRAQSTEVGTKVGTTNGSNSGTYTTGTCVAAAAPPCASSARCACD